MKLSLSLSLPDGRDELVPVVRWDPDDEHLEAARRPAEGAEVVLALLGAVVVAVTLGLGLLKLLQVFVGD